jgi:uncharacterized protein (DUF885 family)
MQSLQVTRRSILAGAAALAATPALTRIAPAAISDNSPTEGLLASMAEQLLAEFPENATALGLDKDGHAALKSRLTDRSLEGVHRQRAAAASRLAKLESIAEDGLPDEVRTNVEVARYAHKVALEGYRFPYGDVVVLNNQISFRNSPYVVTQNQGAWYEVPDFLDSFHQVHSRSDAEAYLSRLNAFAEELDGETQRLRRDAGAGASPPGFILDGALKQIRALRAKPSGMAESLAKRTKSIPGSWRARAERIVNSRVLPALDRQIAELEKLRSHARPQAGVWKLPDGDAYYAWALRASTTTQMTPDEVHQLGLDRLAMLNAKMDSILRTQGLTNGSVGERLDALGKDPRYLFPNTDPGRLQLLDYVNGRVADIRARMPRAFNTLVPGNLLVKRVPPEIEAGAPGGYAAPGTMDGTVPGYYYINLRDTNDLPKWSLPTLTYHEGIPGHIWQGEYSYKLPLIRTLLSFNAYSEGWALYSEQLADELGAYDEDPLGGLGYLQSMAFRAARLVVDTGMHSKRWGREDALHWFMAATGQTEGSLRSEIDRYCAWPGQACGYEVGHTAINRLRDKSKAELGPKYDLKAFDDAVVLGGNVPMDVLTQVIDEYVAKTKAA